MIWIDVNEGTTYYKKEFNILGNVSLPCGYEDHPSVATYNIQVKTSTT